MHSIIQSITKNALVLFFLLSIAFIATAEPKLSASSAILIDADTRTVLYAANPDKKLPAASITKLVTAYVIQDMLEKGLLKNKPVTIPHSLYDTYFPQDASMAHLVPGQTTSIDELMRLLLVYSANDAAYALAIIASGTVADFVKNMNLLVASLGYTDMHFAEPSGLSPANTITARSIALFAADYIKRFYPALAKYHSLPYVEYNGKTLYNRNKLLATYTGLDGLKTGYIEESGFNLVATAERGGFRLISAVLGVYAPSYWSGIEERDKQTAALLDWGFANYVRIVKNQLELNPPRVWYGDKKNIRLKLMRPLTATIRKDSLNKLKVTTSLKKEYFAPIDNNRIMGTATLTDGDRELDTCPIIPAEPVGRGSLLRIIADFFIRLWNIISGK